MNELLNRLKNSINKEVLKHIDETLMEQNNFVPISVKDKFLFVAVDSNADKVNVNKILKEHFPYQIKFIQISDSDLKELLLNISSSISSSVQEKNKMKRSVFILSFIFLTGREIFLKSGSSSVRIVLMANFITSIY